MADLRSEVSNDGKTLYVYWGPRLIGRFGQTSEGFFERHVKVVLWTNGNTIPTTATLVEPGHGENT